MFFQRATEHHASQFNCYYHFAYNNLTMSFNIYISNSCLIPSVHYKMYLLFLSLILFYADAVPPFRTFPDLRLFFTTCLQKKINLQDTFNGNLKRHAYRPYLVTASLNWQLSASSHHATTRTIPGGSQLSCILNFHVNQIKM